MAKSERNTSEEAPVARIIIRPDNPRYRRKIKDGNSAASAKLQSDEKVVEKKKGN